MIIKVKGMHCESCEKLLAIAIEDAVPGAKVKKADYKKGTIDVDAPATALSAVQKAVTAEGYKIA
ncbi:MAG: copper chaperone [Candidatus Micrarchaeota archaeon]